MKRSSLPPNDDSITNPTKKARKEGPEAAAPTPLPPGPRLHVFIGYSAESEDNAITAVIWHAETSKEWQAIEARLRASRKVGQLVEYFETAARITWATAPDMKMKQMKEWAVDLGVAHIDHKELGQWDRSVYNDGEYKRPIRGPIHKAWPCSFDE